MLIIGYVLTNAVYAFTFGQYLGHVVGLGAWFSRVAAVSIMAFFIGAASVFMACDSLRDSAHWPLLRLQSPLLFVWAEANRLHSLFSAYWC